MTATKHTQLTAPNQSIKAADGVRYAFRRYGNPDTSAVPLLMLQHFRGNIDGWDPQLVDTLAQEREVILLDYAGVGGSGGALRTDIEGMAQDVVAFTNAAGLKKFDLLGFSMGGFVAQVVAMIRPHLVRRLVLAGTGPEGGANMPNAITWSGDVLEALTRDEVTAESHVGLFFENTETSRELGFAYLSRIFSRTEDRDAPTDAAVREAQLTAIMKWSVPDTSRLGRLAAISQPTLVANGDNDIVVPTENTYRLAQHIPNATVSIYPDAGHGFLFQYPEAFGAEVNKFLGH
jgi:pimeloyl-ACP methyl ester carboxylesterase